MYSVFDSCLCGVKNDKICVFLLRASIDVSGWDEVTELLAFPMEEALFKLWSGISTKLGEPSVKLFGRKAWSDEFWGWGDLYVA